MKRDVEHEIIIRKGVSKQAINFTKTVVKREFFNPSNRPTNFEWKIRQAKITEKTAAANNDPAGKGSSDKRQLVINSGAVGHHINNLNEIYTECFPALVKMQPAEFLHRYVFDMTKKLNTIASIVNSVSIFTIL